MFRFVYLTALLLPAGTFAGTVIYTDSAHPVIPGSSAAQVVYLDAPDKIQADLFTGLSADPRQAEARARAVLTSPEFRQRQADLSSAFAGVIKAWQLQLQRYPAVVFDDNYVVYGTTDVDLASAHLSNWQEARR
ncbi:TIGR03757 family integrating conjugative element protein [Dickeya fangzhongdai]|uniref:TIGR03757 family integrating conjugative element protein n=1 Tax=Dickeya fangzhongdai TaxID=1778540 RepID=UPI00136F1FB6|nr:TIGR03757 family integrating conjugative element protein [Dickeya fangzhongdai]UMB77386.1 TIGR03757 family integrating conjugative element protein [Dickeya fangzhongdai]